MSTWFSASAVITELRADWHLSSNQSSFLTIAVQLGFVAGALISAALSLADVIPPRRVMAVCAIGAAAANAGLLAVHSAWPAIGFRFLTGMFLAGVYPPSLKAMSTWFRERRGMALGVMVGALTLGAALPHLLHALVNLDWHSVIIATSGATAVGALVALVGSDGPYPFPRATFSPRQAYAVLSNRKVRLASYGYFGHMWELYAMWTWIATYLATSLARSGHSGTDSFSSLAAFAAIGSRRGRMRRRRRSGRPARPGVADLARDAVLGNGGRVRRSCLERAPRCWCSSSPSSGGSGSSRTPPSSPPSSPRSAISATSGPR